ncbi:hypothetical protein [Streptomyces sp. Da 82-17]|uniref:hypothetical protein n=1 Tax=Streptomyces sp. Da 82-17 TaxID=3377116 RepID=UPI0038D3D439
MIARFGFTKSGILSSMKGVKAEETAMRPCSIGRRTHPDGQVDQVGPTGPSAGPIRSGVTSCRPTPGGRLTLA